MMKACPVSNQMVAEQVCRLNGVITALVALLTIITKQPWFVLVLGIDLLLRGFVNTRYSFVGALSRFLVSLLRLTLKMTNAGPKIFAAQIAFAFCALITASLFMGWTIAAQIIAAIMLICALLEALLNFCVACQLYPLLLLKRN